MMRKKGLLKSTKSLCAMALVVSSLGLGLAAMPQTAHAGGIVPLSQAQIENMRNFNSPAIMQDFAQTVKSQYYDFIQNGKNIYSEPDLYNYMQKTIPYNYRNTWKALYGVDPLATNNQSVNTDSQSVSGVQQENITANTSAQGNTTTSVAPSSQSNATTSVAPSAQGNAFASSTQSSTTPVTTSAQLTWYSETGTFILGQSLKLRTNASSEASVIANLNKDEHIKYDAYAIHDGYVWLRQPRSNGQYGYIICRNAATHQAFGTFH